MHKFIQSTIQENIPVYAASITQQPGLFLNFSENSEQTTRFQRRK